MMKKNILIFRSAKHEIVKKNISYLNVEKNKVYLCVQEQCIDIYKEMKNVELIVFPNGFFDYKKTRKNKELCEKLKIVKYDEVYVPYSTQEPECREIENIIYWILGIKKIYFYNAIGEIETKHTHLFQTCTFLKNTKKKILLIGEYIYLKAIYFVIKVAKRR